MREIEVGKIKEAVAKLCIDSNYYLPEDVWEALVKGKEMEESPAGKEVFDQLLENAKIAKEEGMPICQDTGVAVFFVEIGQDVHIVGGDLNEAINEGVREGYKNGYLRKSMCHPFTRKNTGDNTPAVIHTEIVPGEKIRISIAPKGGGSENMSSVCMLSPAVGKEGVIKHVVERVIEAGSNPCPPTIIGVGIGGTFEMAAILAKKALLRKVGSKNPDPELAEMEEEILKRINKSGIGPQGLGGRITSLAVHINMMPCHIASLPVAVNVQCHAARHKEIEL